MSQEKPSIPTGPKGDSGQGNSFAYFFISGIVFIALIIAGLEVSRGYSGNEVYFLFAAIATAFFTCISFSNFIFRTGLSGSWKARLIIALVIGLLMVLFLAVLMGFLAHAAD